MGAASEASVLGKEFVIIRIFEAPRELVFAAWTDPKHVPRWWGPRGFTNPVCQWDAKPGNKIHVVMRAPNGVDYPMAGEFREIDPPNRLVFTSGALDENGNMLFEFLHTVTFAESGGKTTLTIHSRVTQTTPEANKYIGGFEAGMSQSLEKLAADLASIRSSQTARENTVNEPNSPAALVGDREIAITRLLEAPRDLVWKVWTDPKHLARWWGPNGFITTTFSMDVKPGGVWRFVMHGPDGNDYENKITYLEVDAPRRLVYQHGGDKTVEPVSFQVTVTFDDAGSKTKLNMRMVFLSAAARDFIVKTYGAVDGLTQTIGHLAEHVAKVGTPEEAFIITRTFNAPRDLVWKAWTERDRLMEWFGPKGFTMSTANMDFRPGGIFHYALRSPTGQEMWGKFTYREIIPPQRIVLVNSFSDAAGGITAHPMSPTWPKEMLTTTTFGEHDGKTTVMIQWQPLNATPAERATFHAARDGMMIGWTGTFEQLDAYLAGK